jgi:hypothetical protein
VCVFVAGFRTAPRARHLEGEEPGLLREPPESEARVLAVRKPDSALTAVAKSPWPFLVLYRYLMQMTVSGCQGALRSVPASCLLPDTLSSGKTEGAKRGEDWVLVILVVERCAAFDEGLVCTLDQAGRRPTSATPEPTERARRQRARRIGRPDSPFRHLGDTPFMLAC